LAHDYFRESTLNFIGNVEGRDLFSGRVQIIVCDGFVGNVALKVCEGMAEAIARMLKQEMLGTPLGKASLLLGRKGFRRLKDTLDYAEYGGAPLLGVNGVGIVCHGGSSPKAIKNAVKMARRYVKNRIQEKLSQNIDQFQKIWESSSPPNSNVN
jgi:glycerol-3-phosphate acyltransferase PlsX